MQALRGRTELHAFVAYAVDQLKEEGVKEFTDYPEEHHGFFAKLIHESYACFRSPSLLDAARLQIG
jgi:hypothetical protein